MNPDVNRRVSGALLGGVLALLFAPLYVDPKLPKIARDLGAFMGMSIGIGVGAFALPMVLSSPKEMVVK